jgi:DNA-directed RNA polymerase specialized sigma54-like protein
MDTNWSNLNKDKKEQVEVQATVSSQIYEARQTRKKQRDNETFQKWLGERTDKVEITDVLTHLCRDVIKTVNEKGFTITNEKRLKNEIATFIYKEASIYA